MPMHWYQAVIREERKAHRVASVVLLVALEVKFLHQTLAAMGELVKEMMDRHSVVS